MENLRTTVCDFRIYFEDTDITGVVYHANYVKYCERGRSEALRKSFSDLGALMHTDDPCTFAVSEMNIAFKAPARLDDVISVKTTLAEARGARLVFDQEIMRGEDLLAAARVVVAVITLDGRPRRMPEAMRLRMKELTG